ncbi:MAG TPA: stage II sporulation protein P [Clostridia bacterium]|nr:stage II sporulation protein P [Clostridia bacterium]
MQNRSRLLVISIMITMVLSILTPIGFSIADDWYEEELGYFTLFDENGEELTTRAGEMLKNDEYISGDNRHYSISRVNKGERSAYGKYLGDIELPEFEEIEDLAMETLAPKGGQGKILLYCTHGSESYVPSDGEASIPSGGGIYDVAESLKKGLEKKGVESVLDKTSHDPHDAGAYRRSRQTAVDLIRSNMPVAAVFDIHRDATPKKAYDTMVNGEYMSKVRIVIGKRNQNRKANEELAYKIKAVADKAHPGLIKDIYIGSGMYNQELSPRSLLLEMGTHEISKEAAQKSATYIADVISKAIFGGNIKAQAKEETNGGKAEGKAQERPKGKDTGQSKGQAGGRDKGASQMAAKEKSFKVEPINQENPKGGSRGVIWLVVIAVVGVIGFALISMSKNEMAGSFSGMFGKRRKD